ncbi:hypothetical protein BVRB_1g009990 [Beta vulgaris subsp. vulgaris]|uniref:putative transcription elongation factor SPT5 homolog 1 n=1 Tax=Beta vulgaris subsp. vulgaris TaxID=3555 RepID=UPI0005401075|nr:putative transcription elongation factor SPT5 homolog 1 [Beta vulgaris subsp. vulgaris]KMT19955.1 hypothetical protein BVRB_1g009990 [Beta vulgaris subsp. vulgaris]
MHRKNLGEEERIRRKRQREEREGDEEEEDETPEKRRVNMYLDLDAIEDDADEEEDDEDEFEDGFIVHSGDDIADEYEVGESVPNSRFVDRRDEEEMDVEAMEKMVNERYGSRSLEGYDEDFAEEITEVEQQALLPSVRDPKLWLVKCLPGREREVAASLMQKSLNDFTLHILSAIALDHLKNYIYVEAYCEAHVMQACKGMRNVFARNVSMVPMKDMSNVLCVQRKDVHVSTGDWVRLKRSNYKGSLAKVVDVDTVKHKITVKVTPKLGALSLSDRMEGVDYLYKTVALTSIATGNINPSIQEVENFREIGETDANLGTLFKGKENGCWMRGDAVVVVKGDLKNLKGSIEHVEGDIVHIKPNEKIPLKTIAIHKRDLAKYFEPGCHVKVICGVQKGTTGMVVKVDQMKLVILSDASKDHITVFARQVIESRETSENSSEQRIRYNNQDRRHQKVSSSRYLPQSASSYKLLPDFRPSPTLGQRTAHTRKRHDSLIGSKVKIIQGPYRGYRGCVKGVNGHNVRVELEAQMKVITVERNHITDKLTVPKTIDKMAQQRTGGETPLHPRTPLHSMGGETPWRTPFRSPRPSTPIFHGSGESGREQWNPCSLTSPSRLVPTP